MKRREFITLLGAVAAGWALAARAQQAGKMWRIAFITHGHQLIYEQLFAALRELGYEEGQNIIIERRYAEGRAEKFQVCTRNGSTQGRSDYNDHDARCPCRQERDHNDPDHHSNRH